MVDEFRKIILIYIAFEIVLKIKKCNACLMFAFL